MSKPVLGDYAQAWRELMAGRQLPIIPAWAPPGNPEATPECSAYDRTDWDVCMSNDTTATVCAITGGLVWGEGRKGGPPTFDFNSLEWGVSPPGAIP